MPLFPSKEEIMWVEVKIIWGLCLAIVFVHLFISCKSQHSPFFMRVVLSMIAMFVSLQWNLQMC